MSKCVSCGDTLPPLNGCEENDFRSECDACDSYIDDDVEYDPDCRYCGRNHETYLCDQIKRFDDMDCFKCGETFFFRDGHCVSCGNKQY